MYTLIALMPLSSKLCKLSTPDVTGFFKLSLFPLPAYKEGAMWTVNLIHAHAFCSPLLCKIASALIFHVIQQFQLATDELTSKPLSRLCALGGLELLAARVVANVFVHDVYKKSLLALVEELGKFLEAHNFEPSLYGVEDGGESIQEDVLLAERGGSVFCELVGVEA